MLPVRECGRIALTIVAAVVYLLFGAGSIASARSQQLEQMSHASTSILVDNADIRTKLCFFYYNTSTGWGAMALYEFSDSISNIQIDSASVQSKLVAILSQDGVEVEAAVSSKLHISEQLLRFKMEQGLSGPSNILFVDESIVLMMRYADDDQGSVRRVYCIFGNHGLTAKAIETELPSELANYSGRFVVVEGMHKYIATSERDQESGTGEFLTKLFEISCDNGVVRNVGSLRLSGQFDYAHCANDNICLFISKPRFTPHRGLNSRVLGSGLFAIGQSAGTGQTRLISQRFLAVADGGLQEIIKFPTASGDFVVLIGLNSGKLSTQVAMGGNVCAEIQSEQAILEEVGLVQVANHALRNVWIDARGFIALELATGDLFLVRFGLDEVADNGEGSVRVYHASVGVRRSRVVGFLSNRSASSVIVRDSLGVVRVKHLLALGPASPD